MGIGVELHSEYPLARALARRLFAWPGVVDVVRRIKRDHIDENSTRTKFESALPSFLAELVHYCGLLTADPLFFTKAQEQSEEIAKLATELAGRLERMPRWWGLNSVGQHVPEDVLRPVTLALPHALGPAPEWNPWTTKLDENWQRIPPTAAERADWERWQSRFNEDANLRVTQLRSELARLSLSDMLERLAETATKVEALQIAKKGRDRSTAASRFFMRHLSDFMKRETGSALLPTVALIASAAFGQHFNNRDADNACR